MAADIQTIELTAIDDATIELSVDGAVISTVTLDMETSMLDASAVVNIVKQYVLAMQQNVEAEIPTELSQLINDMGFISEDTNTTYTLTKSGDTLTLTGSDGSVYNVTVGNVAPSETYTQTGSDGWRFAYVFPNGDEWVSPYYQSGTRLTGVSFTKSNNFEGNDRLTFTTKQNEAAGNPINLTLPSYAFSLNANTKKLSITRVYINGVYTQNIDFSSIIPTAVTYSLSITGNVITLTGSDGSTSTATLPVYDGGTT